MHGGCRRSSYRLAIPYSQRFIFYFHHNFRQHPISKYFVSVENAWIILILYTLWKLGFVYHFKCLKSLKSA